MNTHKGKTILIVDDNAELVEMLAMFLRREYQVVTATDGHEGLKQLEKMAPDLILLDVGMPKMDGFEFCKAVMTSFGHLRYPVLMLTGRDELREVFNSVQVSGFLTKPFELEELGREIWNILESVEKPNVFLVDRKDGAHSKEIGDILGKESYRSVVVESLLELKSASLSIVPDFVLVEYLQEEMKGDDFVRETRKILDSHCAAALPLYRRPRILVYSYSGLDYKDKSLKAGADLYLGKPETPKAFVQAMRQLEIKKVA